VNPSEPVWIPRPGDVAHANVTALMRRLGLDSYDELHRWSIEHREAYWESVVASFEIAYAHPPDVVLDASGGPYHPRWLPGAMLNIVESCLDHDPSATAVLSQAAGGDLRCWSVAELKTMSARVANGLLAQGLGKGARIAIVAPLTAEAVAMYLGIIRIGAAAVSIPESFSASEIARRIRITDAAAVFTQDVILRGSKTLPLYERIVEAQAPPAIVLPGAGHMTVALRDQDRDWANFLSEDAEFETIICDAEDPINILFSSGTTGDPKAIPWNHVSPLKGAADARYHMDVHPGDVLAWPTSLGWMMGPWLILSSLLNRATIAIFDGSPLDRAFGRFLGDAGVTMLGVIPSLVRSWRASECMQDLDWNRIRVMASTGECSNADDMAWLMQLNGHRPLIEYCGGTELAGGYISGTVLHPAIPACFSTLTLGTEALILDDNGAPTENGELFLVPPTIGFTATLLNRDHDEAYHDDTPRGPNGKSLRRHGDQMERLPSGYYRAHGRMDDTMNLGGIKTSSAEIERVVLALESVREVAAIAIPSPGGGPDQLVVYALPETGPVVDQAQLLEEVRAAVKRELNPLFRVHELVITDALPRTPSNKIMRRVLREGYEDERI
jgi:acetyl-CoA synthetase